MNPAKRIKSEYGSVKAALKHCASLDLSVIGTARQLGVSPVFVRKWEERTGVEIRRGKAGEGQVQPQDKPSLKYLRRTNALRHLVKEGYLLSCPETHYKAEVAAGMR